MLRDEITEEGYRIRRIVDLPLVRSQHPVFALGWTLMHVIDDASPLHSETAESLSKSKAVFILSLSGTDENTGQILMARFANSGGLQQIGDNLWAQGVNSGEPLRDIPGSSGIGSLTAGAVELSNSDIGQNLIDLILASTQYSGGTRVITSAQQLLDELLNLRR